MRFERSTKPSTSLGLHQSVWSFHARPAMCMEFWFDLADIYEVLLLTNALPRSATHTSAKEHDESRRADLTKCVENRLPALGVAIQLSMRVCGYRPWSVKVGQGVNATSASTSLSLLQSVWSFHRIPAMCKEFWLDLANIYKVLRPTTALPQ